MNQGMVYVFTGDGKGKTSAAIGTAVRAVGAGMKVAWVGFYKQETWKLSEVELLKKMGVEVWLMGKGFNIKTQNSNVKVQNHNEKLKTAPLAAGAKAVDTATEAEHKLAAGEAMKMAGAQLGQVDLLVMDEVNNAVEDKLINLIDLINLIPKRNQTHLILTGRGARKEIMETADLVTEMRKIKHPYDEGKLAVRGLDF